jgi:hypothetical protein
MLKKNRYDNMAAFRGKALFKAMFSLTVEIDFLSSESSLEPSDWLIVLAPTIEPSMPTQIIFQILGRDPMKSFHPLFEPAVVGINVLDMVNTINDSNASREIDGAVNNAEAMRHRSVDGSTITTKNGIFRQSDRVRPTPVLGLCLCHARGYILPRLRGGRFRWC